MSELVSGHALTPAVKAYSVNCNNEGMDVDRTFSVSQDNAQNQRNHKPVFVSSSTTNVA